MDTNHIVLLAGSEETRRTLVDQLEEIIGDFIKIESYAVEVGFPPIIKNKLVILSSYLVAEEVAPILGESCEILVAERIVNFYHIAPLFALPEGTEVLYVNDFPETVQEAIQSLQELGVEHLQYYPYFPGKKIVKEVSIAITPGEMDLVPSFCDQVINIRPRLLDITTIITILEKLNILKEKQKEVSTRYIKTIIHLSKRISSVTKEATSISEHLKKVVDGVHDGILALNNEGVITVFNGILEAITGVRGKRAIGRVITDIFEDTELQQFILNDKQGINRYFTMNGLEIIVHRFTIDTDTVVVTFKNAGEAIEMEQKRRMELVKKGHFAKYSFQDIVGHNEKLIETKKIANKLAKADLTILIEGESGTGKELFASSIHLASPRKNGPFLAVNFSALPEDLVESELFGYEDGAFTGARKGGRKGLFEQAHGGSIFLDEIGDISLKVQARLLRVLQEKELLRIGGNEIIPIDVRVIAATNRDLLKLIQEGKFREDLYHRLKVLFIHLPELRNRKDDIEELIRYFIHQSGHHHIKVSPAVVQQLKKYQWYGNVRELENTINYMLAVCENNIITLKDIPNEAFFQTPVLAKESITATSLVSSNVVSTELDSFNRYEQELIKILEIMKQLDDTGEPCSRKKIVDEAINEFSEQQVRHRMNLLHKNGLIIKYRGRGGTKITPKGVEFLNSKKDIINV